MLNISEMPGIVRNAELTLRGAGDYGLIYPRLAGENEPGTLS
jgi:hypothetical protein